MADWVDDAWDEIEDDGTEGAFTRQARRAGYADTFAFAQKVMDGWRSGRRRVYNKREKRYQGITEKTMRRANFLINQSGHRANPRGDWRDAPVPTEPKTLRVWSSLFKFLARYDKMMTVASVKAPEYGGDYWTVDATRLQGKARRTREERRLLVYHYGGNDWRVIVDEKA